MISQFWNLCRACPALDVDKLHSEYRSTYRWHEYTPKQAGAVVRTAPIPQQPLSSSDGSEFSRGRKKAPDVAYKCHEFFEAKGGARGDMDHVDSRVTREPRSQGVTFPGASTAPSGWTSRHSSLRSRERSEARERAGDGRDTPKKSISMGQIQPGAGARQNQQDTNGNPDTTDGAVKSSPGRPVKEYKSEYKQRYRPFSQYEYIGDGKFHNTSTSPPGDAVDTGPGAGTMVHKISARRQHERAERGANLAGEPWYQEVIELRKQANDYKCRGWGTDLVPPHLSQIYSQHVDEATQRESLSALALAITPRSLNKDEKEKENQRKSGSPMKVRSRPRTAPPKGSKKTSRSESARSTPGPAKTEVDSGDGKIDAEARDKISEPRKGASRPSSKAQSRDVSRPPSAIENNIDYFKEPVVKSPPEPTRVRSPEQLMMRSPDPINWTVPLDTGKTFQVTQCVRDTESARNSPMSDHSSHFDSVLGTAINLGIHSVNEKGSLTHPKVSVLAREAKELQGVRSPPSPSPVPPAQAPVAAAPKKDEGLKPSAALAPCSSKSENSESSGYVTSSNAKINGAQEAASNGIEKDKNDNKIEPVPLQPAKSGANNIKCLEDPSFSLDEAKTSSVTSLPVDTTEITAKKTEVKEAPTTKAPEHALAPQPKKPSYRVLEDPDLEIPPPRSGSMVSDPMTTSIYEPKQ